MKHILFVINPISGSGHKADIAKIAGECLDSSRFSFETVFTGYAGHAEELSYASGADIVAAVGGDGTVNEVVRGLLRSAAEGKRKALAIIPCGSGDGLALHLGISRNVRKAIQALNDDCQAPLDCARMGDRTIASISGAGFDALVSWNFTNSGKRGLKTYISEALKAWRTYTPEHYEIQADGNRWEGDAVMVSVGNSNQWGNMARITPLASVSDGKLDVTVIKPFRTIDIPLLAARLMLGRMDRSRKAECLRGSRITLRRSSEAPAHFDGDPCMMGPEIVWETMPAALDVMIPATKKGKI